MNFMKATYKVAIMISLIISASSLIGTADTVQYLTLAGRTDTNGTFLSDSYPLQTNQIVSVAGYDWASAGTVYGRLADGTLINLTPCNARANAYSSSQIPQIATGMTNITVGFGSATFQITTPACANVVSNYVPADAIVIPASATGNVQIILESSIDLVNWTAANPGTYSASSATNRFFRVRGVSN
jgi:hypothetical protein